MKTPRGPKASNKAAPPQDQRRALQDAERKASETQPRNFDERNLSDKIVTIPPKDKSRVPIKGLDPK